MNILGESRVQAHSAGCGIYMSVRWVLPEYSSLASIWHSLSHALQWGCLPCRFAARRPFLAPVGRLDKDTSGLLLLTDDGTLLQRIISPKKGIWKVGPRRGKSAPYAVA